MKSVFSNEIIELIGKIQRLNYQFRPSLKIPHGEFIMLCAIQKLEEVKKQEGKCQVGNKVSEISNILDSSRPATSKMLNNIEEKGLIERITDKKDRRVVYINLTEKGRTILEQHKEEVDNFVSHVIKRLGEEDAKELLRIFNELYVILEEEHHIRVKKGKDV